LEQIEGDGGENQCEDAIVSQKEYGDEKEVDGIFRV
jgi:hypothetical protein